MTLLNELNVGSQQYGMMGVVPMGTCATPAGTAIKESAFADDFELSAGNLISVTFTYANTYGDGSTTYPSLKIGSYTYPIKYPTGAYATSGAWANGQAVTFMFDGVNLIMTHPVATAVQAGNNLPVTSAAVAAAISDIPYSKYTRLSANADMNDCTDAGTLYYSGSASDIVTFINKPTFTNAGEMSLITIQLGASAYLMQLYFAKEGINNSVAKRVYNSGTWSDWEKISTNSDISDTTIHKIWGTLIDNTTQDVVLNSGRTYLYLNTHVYNIEMVLFSFVNGNVQTLCRLTNYNITDFLGLDISTVRLTANGACRGFIFQLGNTLGS